MLLKYFTDPLLMSSMWGTILMCLSTSLIGTLAFIRRESLIGETLSHAAFPGAVIGVMLSMTFFPSNDTASLFILIASAFLFSLLGMGVVVLLIKQFKLKEDSALCFVLSTFVGVGVFIASILQTLHPLWFRQVSSFFYGQAATLMNIHVVSYAVLSLSILLFVVMTFPKLKIANFDTEFAKSVGLEVIRLNLAILVFFSLAVVIGIKAVGVVLMSGMLIAPALAARAWTHKLSIMFILSSCFGILSAILGNILSYEIPKYYSGSFSLPTGPLILLIAALFSLLSLFFAPKKGLVYRFCRVKNFQKQCVEENFVKSFWKNGLTKQVTLSEAMSIFHLPKLKTWCLLFLLTQKKDLFKEAGNWGLTEKGKKRAAHIVRVHRLFELYLSSKLNVKGDMIHEIAEEMEHYITLDLEKELTQELSDPKRDPHSQPIPKTNFRGEVS
ncbi:MAG: iron chelate uptake ABC transporter family permease subunit [Rhabdochlamydiaceae bacterium]|nr:iron chelate uptake ABC transporter family permease subunit [Candidatus Amphrikana amoebophyrae]